MAKRSLASMPLGALMKLRDRVGVIISRRADALKKELRSLGEDYKEVGRIAIYGKKKSKRRKTGPGTGRRNMRPDQRKAVAKSRRSKTGKRSATKRKA